TEHGEVGFDLGLAMEMAPVTVATEPRAAKVPPRGHRYSVVLDGVENGSLLHAWSELCVPSENPDPQFQALYSNVTTVKGNRFQLRGVDPAEMSAYLQDLMQKRLGKPLRARVEAA